MTTADSLLIPLYARVASELRREICAGMKPGELLPSEVELQRRFAVSRITIRRSLADLTAEGLIVRERGRGTFVRERHITEELTRLMSWTVAMREQGFEPRTLKCRIDRCKPDAEIAATLDLRGSEAIRIRRSRVVSGGPVTLMTNYVREEIAPDLEHSGLLNGSLYETLSENGIIPGSAIDRVQARGASSEEARELSVTPGSIVLQVTRAAFDALSTPLYVAVVVNIAAGHEYIVRVDESGKASPNC